MDPFTEQLDANPTDWTLRLVYADWLEEQGDEVCETQRWMAENEKSPEHVTTVKSWTWANSMYYTDDHVNFETRHAAEQWLHEQLKQLGMIPCGQAETLV